MSVAASDGTNPSPFPDTSNKTTLSVLLRCNSDVSFPTLGYLNEKNFWAWAIGGGRPPRPPLNTPMISRVIDLWLHRLIYWLIYWSVNRLIDWLIGWLRDWTKWLIDRRERRPTVIRSWWNMKRSRSTTLTWTRSNSEFTAHTRHMTSERLRDRASTGQQHVAIIYKLRTRDPAIAEGPRVNGTLHWRLSQWINCSWIILNAPPLKSTVTVKPGLRVI